MKPLKICLIMYGFWFIDFLTTIFSVNFLGFEEANKIPGFFYQFWWGWIIFPIITFIILFLLSLLIVSVKKRIEKDNKFLSNFFLYIAVIMFPLFELTVIINNIYLMINYG